MLKKNYLKSIRPAINRFILEPLHKLFRLTRDTYYKLKIYIPDRSQKLFISIQEFYSSSLLKKLIGKIEELANILLSGIRAKLALFTGSLIVLTILFLSAITVQQQTAILTESYEKQAHISRKYISSLVSNLDNITENLIRIEKFRAQIAEQIESRKKYKTKRVVQVDKQISLFGFKTNLFGTMGKQNFYQSKDTFYSQYLTNKDIQTLEDKIKEQLDRSAGRIITDNEWKQLQKIANRYTKLDANSGDELNPNLLKIRSELEHKIASFIIESKKKNIEDLGLDTHRFRMQTYLLSKLDETENIESSFDTKIFDPDATLAQLDDNNEMMESLKIAFHFITSKPNGNMADVSESLTWNDLEIQLLYSPLFRNPDSTERARQLSLQEKDLAQYKKFVELDEDISRKIGILYPKIRSIIEVLKKRKPPTPPFRDKIFVNLYKDYNLLVATRQKAFDSIIEEFPPNEFNRIAINSLYSLRESAWEDSILLRYNTEVTNLESYTSDSEFRENYKKRWALLRKWITEAKSELPPQDLQKLIADATIGKSRSEAEELLWQLDSTPILSKEGESLALKILSKNITGIIRTAVDRTDGLNLIRNNRNKVILSAFVIGLLSIMLAIFISGVVVQKIKRIIESAEDVEKGNLDVEFEHGGNDEFGKLTIALNSMVQGLNEREKIKGILGSMIDPVVVSEAMKDLQALKRGSEKNITAFFSDIASFSTISEKLTSPELANLLNEYLSAMTTILKNYDGVLDKYIGDAIVGIFNSPLDVEDHVYKAVLASLDMQNKLIELKEEWSANNKYIPEARSMMFRIGLNAGIAKVGFMGTDALASYTMMGDTVNLAARLEAAGKDYGVNILASESVYREIEGRIFTRKLDMVRVKGKTEPVVLYEILCRRGEETESLKKATELYELGFAKYLEKNWNKAIEFFEESLQARNSIDVSSKLLIERCKDYKSNPPSDDWDGVTTRKTK